MLDIGLLKQYADEGLTRKAISEKIGMSYSRTTTVLREHGIHVSRKKHDCKKRGPRKQTIKILELRNKGMMHKEIAVYLGCCEDTVKQACKKYGLTKDCHVNETDAIDTVSSAGFDYVGGFTNTKGTITIRCRECGCEFIRYYDAVRNEAHGKRKEKLTCPHCQEKIIEERRKKKQEIKEREAQMKAQHKAEQLSRKVSDQLTRRLAIHVCKNCGQEYCIESTGYNSEQYCSGKCQQRWHDRIKNEKRMDRLVTREHDADITLEKLFNRDGGICYICGKACDWSDIINRDGTMIAGGNYPSIDHVKPVSKGGTHTWGNIMLACRSCNTLKGWK